jgi:cytochrome c553
MLSINRIVFSFLLLIPVSTFAFQADHAEPKNEEFTAQQLEYFETKVRPILVNRCHECHSGNKVRGGLNLESREAVLKGGDYGPAIEVGDPEESLIIDAVNYGDFYEMPPNSKLPQEEIDILTKWVTDGAAWPKTDKLAEAGSELFNLAERKSDHWCWNPVQPVTPPKVEGDWATDPIDQFIQKRINEAGLEVAKKADRPTLLRRLCFDLTGLPPTDEQIQAFVVDNSITVEELVDELLNSPHFGERWARHWMDLTRYAETCGHEFDYPIPNAHQYRDYLIRAFNADVPYNQFVKEHIAGDLITNPRINPNRRFNESILGTGFWFLGEATHAPVDVKGDEAGRVDNQIDVMTKTFLGVTVACARCHDHKFDAISTKDYYALAGFLQSSRRQEAMLDYDEKILTAVNEVEPLHNQTQDLLKQLSDQLGKADPERLANYFIAALTVARTNPKWFADRAIVIEGETLRTIQSENGVVETQEIKPEGKLNWSGNKQTWWRDGSNGDTWELEFEVSSTGQYAVQFIGTVAPDYGATKIYLNGSSVVERTDFFGPELTTKTVQLGSHSLKAGKHVIKFELQNPNDKAIPRNMLGVDLLTCQPLEAKSGGVDPLTPQQVASDRGLEVETLKRLLRSMESPALKQTTHPLHVLQKMMNGRVAWNPRQVNKLTKALLNKSKAANDSDHKLVMFADFDDPDHGWYQTGVGFQTPADEYSMVDDAEVIPPGVVNSGALGGKLFGVLRSPTFVITHRNIHIRLRSRNARLRLVIDGFVMDEYNALLYRGAFAKNVSHEQFEWRTMAQDIHKYIGHRAHFEIIDKSDGFVAVDQICFSDGPAPNPAPSRIGNATLSSNPTDLDSTSRALAEQVIRAIGDDQTADPGERAELLSWLIKSDLVAALIDSSETNTATGDASPSASLLAGELKQTRVRLLSITDKVPPPVLAPAMTDGSGENEFVFVRGNHKTLGKPAERQFLEAIVGDDSQRFSKQIGSGRMDLVDQMVAPKNPLTSRVMVNRIWYHMLGRGIVSSVDNFGVLGDKPTHPELLDYLADDFVQNGWSVKKLMRKIALSSTYQMSSKPNPAAQEVDPDNHLLHRARIRRLQGESIRDSILSASGELDRKMFGYSVPIHLTDFMQGRGRPRNSGPLDGEGRRSVYLEVRRNFLSPMMLAFDTPIPFNSTGRRNQSNVPAQALILMNDPFVIDQAKKWAESLSENKSLEGRVKSIYRSAFARQPTDSELKSARDFIKVQAETLDRDEMSVEVWQDFCHIVFNVKEFIYIK